MLPPEQRSLYSSFFVPPDGFALDHAVGTTFTLDLRTLLVLPLTLATRRAAEADRIEDDPLAVLDASREAAKRLTVFHHHGRIHLPPTVHPLYSLVEGCVVPVRPKNDKGVFHPKVWALRFVGEDDDGEPQVLLRVAVLSRNLTFDRSWDFSLVLEGSPWGRRVRANYGLADIIESSPKLAVDEVESKTIERCIHLADEIRRTPFSSPDGFTGGPTFHALGLDGRSWRPTTKQSNRRRVLVVSPFVSAAPVQFLNEFALDEGILVSRDDELSKLKPEDLESWSVSCVHDNANAAADAADEAGQPSDPLAPNDGLHAKMIAVEHGRSDVTWWLGSANATNAAWEGRNVELVVELQGRRSQVGIDKFMDAGFENILEAFIYSAPDVGEQEQQRLLAQVEELRDAIARAPLFLSCESGPTAGAQAGQELTDQTSLAENLQWRMTLSGDLELDPTAKVNVRPVTLPSSRAFEARQLAQEGSIEWRGLAAASLSRLVAFEVSAQSEEHQVGISFALLLPFDGMPVDRDSSIVRSLIESRGAFLRYLRFILAGDDPVSAFGEIGKTTALGGAVQSNRYTDEVLLEDMMKALSRDPFRLLRVERLVEDLLRIRKTGADESGEPLLSDEFLKMWEAVKTVAHERMREINRKEASNV